MRGRIKVGPPWLRFKADWEGDGRSFEWRARAARGLVRVVDRYAGAAAAVDQPQWWPFFEAEVVAARPAE